MNDLRSDLQVIADLVPPGARVLDVGCGDGALLHWLATRKQVEAGGIELGLAGVNACLRLGLPVIQGDGDTDLAHYPDASYDYVILSQTLQALRDPREVLLQLVRIGRHAIVSVPNFGHWRNRLYLALRGRMPVTRALSYQWHDTPNIHFCTIRDFLALCDTLGLVVERRLCIDAQGRVRPFHRRFLLANLLGEQGVFLLKRAVPPP